MNAVVNEAYNNIMPLQHAIPVRITPAVGKELKMEVLLDLEYAAKRKKGKKKKKKKRKRKKRKDIFLKSPLCPVKFVLAIVFIFVMIVVLDGDCIAY